MASVREIVDLIDNRTVWINDGKEAMENLLKNHPVRKIGNGSTRWYLNGQLHREDGPAVEYANGTKEWWVDGKHVKTERA